MNSPENIIGQQIRSCRSDRGISLRSLACSLGVSPATLSNVERGKVGLNVSRLKTIARLLDIETVEMLGAKSTKVTGGRNTKGCDFAAFSFGSPRPAAIRNWRHYAPLELDSVLSAALREIQRSGYHGTSVREIAKAAGLSVSGMYHHYTSKQEMLYNLLHIGTSELLERSDAACRDGRTPSERFCNLIEHLALWHCYRRAIGFVGASEMRSLDPENSGEIVDMRRRQQELINREVDAAVRSGRFSAKNPRGAARAMVTMCVAISTWYDPQGPHSPETIAAQYVDIAMGAMGAARG